VKSAVAVTTPEDAGNGKPRPGQALRIVRLAGYAVLAVQFACFAVWSVVLYDRFSLTWDYATNYQAWYLVAHGNLDPFNTTQGYFFWRDHSEFIMWLLAPFYWLWPNGPVLLFLQDAAVVVAEVTAFTWICELARKYRPASWDAVWLAGAGLVLLVANPWTWWAVSFDFHTECVAAAFLVLAARDLWAGRRRAWIWVVLALTCGDVAAAYTAAVGVGALLGWLVSRRSWRSAGDIRSRLMASRRSWLPGLAVTVIAVAALEITKVVHSDQSSPLWAYTYLQSPPSSHFSMVSLVRGIVVHPGNTLRVLWSKHHNTWENLASGGLIGAVFACLLPLAFVVVATNDLTHGYLFTEPGFQSIVLYVIVPVGTIGLLGALARRWRMVAGVLAGLALAQSLYITSSTAPRVEPYWLHVSPSTAATLNQILPRIPASDQVLASWGVVGRFAGRKDIQSLFGHDSEPLDGGTVWIVVSPVQGVVTMTPQESAQFITELETRYHARLMVTGGDVWAFRWTPPHGLRSLPVP
jgi:hypothetical protein